MLSPNVVPGTKVVGLENCPGPYSCIRPQWWWVLQQMQDEGSLLDPDHGGSEFTVLSVRPEKSAVSGFAVMFLETGEQLWPLECYQELQPRPAARLERRVLEPA